MTSLILAGVGIVGSGLVLRALLGSMKHVQKHVTQLPKSPMFTSYYKGGFEPKVSRREAGLILGKSSALRKSISRTS